MYSVRLKKVKLQKFLLKNLHGKKKCSTFAEKLEKAVSVRFDSVRRCHRKVVGAQEAGDVLRHRGAVLYGIF